MNRQVIRRSLLGGKKKKQKRPHHALHVQRRNMDITGALIRCLLACGAFILVGGALEVSGAYGAMPPIVGILVRLLLSVLCFGVTAAYGLFAADGDQTDKLYRQALSAQQLRYLLLTGALLVCPTTLLTDLFAALVSRFGLAVSGEAAAPAFALFLPVLARSVLIAPIIEEVFFRGYFFAALREAGSRHALWLTALFFALCHGVDVTFAAHFLLGLLLGAVMLKTKSLPAAIAVHAAYNLAIVLLSFVGLGGLFSGLGFASCLLRLLGCAALFAVLKRALSARHARREFAFGGRLTLRQSITVAAAAVLLIAATAFMQFDWKPGMDMALEKLSPEQTTEEPADMQEDTQ